MASAVAAREKAAQDSSTATVRVQSRNICTRGSLRAKWRPMLPVTPWEGTWTPDGSDGRPNLRQLLQERRVGLRDGLGPPEPHAGHDQAEDPKGQDDAVAIARHVDRPTLQRPAADAEYVPLDCSVAPQRG